MKKIAILLIGFLGYSSTWAQDTIHIMKKVVFYDGYATTVSNPTADSIVRLRNDLMTIKLSNYALSKLGSTLQINISIGALCDNYDRIGNVNLVLAPKGSTSYDPTTVKRIEVGRFITPFMNKNINPKSVPYSFVVDNLIKVLKSPDIKSTFDFWLELEVFGVPYAANNEVAGCSGRNDVFDGTVDFITTPTTETIAPSTELIPLNFKFEINDYKAGASDKIGVTKKTVKFTTTAPIYGAEVVFITSNHGANAGGEEYVRRQHLIYFDSVEMMSYIPGGKSCEPYRKFNTQGNGIYGPSTRTPAQWASFSNWCPGDVIPIRSFKIDTLEPGEHTFVIHVPNAVFQDDQGYFPFSLYVQGSKTSFANLNEIQSTKFSIYPNPTSDKLFIQSENTIQRINLIDSEGKQIGTYTSNTISVSQLNQGIYLLQIIDINGNSETIRFTKTAH